MNDLRKAAEMALEALEWNYGTDLENIENCTAWLDKMNAIIPALRQALDDKPLVKTYAGGKPNYCTPEVTGEVTRDVDAVNMTQDRVDETAKGEHEPVGWLDSEGRFSYFKHLDSDEPLYTALPQKEWVGLKDEQVEDEWERITGHSIFGGARSEGRAMYISPDEVIEFSRAIEAKLKEKNGG